MLPWLPWLPRPIVAGAVSTEVALHSTEVAHRTITTLGSSSASGSALPWIVFGLGGIAAAVAWAVQQHRRRELQAALNRFVARHEGWHLQAWPCGVPAEQLVGRFEATPRGDRRYGVEAAAGGPLEVQVNGTPVTCQVGCYVWFHEQRQTNRSNGRTTRTYQRRTDVVAMCQLPVHTHRSVSIQPESILGRVGLTRAGEQLESDAFNRRFRVEGRDRTLVVTLLDAGLQELLSAEYGGRGIEFSDDLLVLSGDPTHRDRSLAGVAETYPAIVQDLRRLLQRIPPPFWRALGFSRPGPGDPSPPPATPAVTPPPPGIPPTPGMPPAPTTPPPPDPEDS